MISTHQITTSINLHTFTFATARLAYRFAADVAADVERIALAAPTVGYIAFTAVVLLAMVVIAAIRFTLPALPVIAKAIVLVSIPALAMFLVLTVPGLPLCLAVFAVFAVGTWAVSK